MIQLGRFNLLHAIFLTIALVAAPSLPMASSKDMIMPPPKTRSELSERLKAAGLSAEAVTTIVTVARDGLILDTAPATEPGIAIGASKFGGLPDLPKGMVWPVRPAYENAAELARQLESEAANLYADAGVPPPWMGEDGKTLVETRRKLNNDAMAGTLQLMKDAGIGVSAFDIGKRPPTDLKSIENEAIALRAKAQAIAEPFPLTFICQLDLGSLAREAGFDPALPKTGRLLLFYDLPILPADFDPTARVGWRLIYDETPPFDLQRIERPAELSRFPAAVALKPSSISSRSVVTTVPMIDSAWYILRSVPNDEIELYHQWLFTLGVPDAPEGGNHQLGGWPRAFQASMQSKSQLAANGIYAGTSDAYKSEAAQSLLSDAKDWQLVMQIGADAVIGQELPGAFYVLMRKQDLSAKNFDRAWVVYEQD
jgi:hypothetical protein